MRDGVLALDAIDEHHLGRLHAVREDLLDRHNGELVYVLLARVEEVEREVVALVDGAELVLLPVLISHDHAVGVARALVPDLQRDVEGLADVIRTVLRGQLLEQQQLGATLLVGQCQRQCTTQRHAEQATHLLSSAQQAVELSAQQCHTQAAQCCTLHSIYPVFEPSKG